jgi:putative colanic acid biosynthesis acetyltransferase WcaF
MPQRQRYLEHDAADRGLAIVAGPRPSGQASHHPTRLARRSSLLRFHCYSFYVYIIEMSAPPIIELAGAGRGNFVAKRGRFIQLAWFVIDALLINNRLMPISAVRAGLLRLFGAKIGKNCRLMHPIRVKYPWNLEIGDDSWFGEDVWIYNQDAIRIGSNVCISQGTFLTTGSHDLHTNMDLRVSPIVVEDGAWVSSKCVIQMGVTIGESAVVTPLSVVHRSLEPGGIYGGNPCVFIKKRFDRAG